MSDITCNQAKKIIAQALKDLGFAEHKLSARAAGFLATDHISVTIHGWKPGPGWAELRRIAIFHGFTIE